MLGLKTHATNTQLYVSLVCGQPTLKLHPGVFPENPGGHVSSAIIDTSSSDILFCYVKLHKIILLHDNTLLHDTSISAAHIKIKLLRKFTLWLENHEKFKLANYLICF